MAAEAVGPAHVEDDFLVRQELVVQAQIVAVGIQLRFVERIDDDVATQPRPEFRCR